MNENETQYDEEIEAYFNRPEEEKKPLPPRDWKESDRFYLTHTNWYHATKLGIRFDEITDDILPYLKAETRFALEEDVEVDEPEEAEGKKLIGIGKQVCTICKGRKEILAKHRGVTTGILTKIPIACPCFAYTSYYTRWENPLVVGSSYREITFANIRDYRSRFQNFIRKGTFEKLMDTIHEYPQGCYLMTGDGGSGKSTLMTALYQGSLEKWVTQSYHNNLAVEAVWKTSALRLSKQFQAWILKDLDKNRREDDPVELPLVTVNKVLQAKNYGSLPCLFIEELDKYKMSDFQNREFFDVLDLIQSNKAQIVATSNLSVTQLRSALGSQYGKPIVRRFIDKPFGVHLDFDNGKIHRSMDKVVVAGANVPKDGSPFEERPEGDPEEAVEEPKVSQQRQAQRHKPQAVHVEPTQTQTQGKSKSFFIPVYAKGTGPNPHNKSTAPKQKGAPRPRPGEEGTIVQG